MNLALFDIALATTTLLCALVAGLLFGFAVLVMPGLAKLPDRDFLQAFKLIDEEIQNGQPFFLFVWVGSVLSTLLLLVLGTIQISGFEKYLMWFGCGLYLVAVQGPTIRINIPLNNAVQALKISSLSDSDLAEARAQFEIPWNRSNRFRTSVAIVSVLILLTLNSLLR